MGLTRQLLLRGAWALLGLAALAAAWDGWAWWQAQRWNAAIAAGGALPDTPSPEIRFARAYAAAARGDPETALKGYRALQDDPRLGDAARFNAANLLLRQALRVRGGPQPGQAITLLELAKEHYRELLRRNPGHWDARYNLERALRLLPDPVDEDVSATDAPQDRERAATTMRAQSLGLP